MREINVSDVIQKDQSSTFELLSMNKKIRLSIPKPCSENWDSFRLSSKGGYCNSCQKTVIDFSKMSDKEIVTYFQNHQSGKTCGRFNSIQLREIGINNSKKGIFPSKYVSAAIVGMSLLLASSESQAKGTDPVIQIDEVRCIDQSNSKAATSSKIIKGKVLDERGEGLPGVSIVLKGTTIGAGTNLDGEFTFPQELNDGDVLVISTIGYLTIEHKISSKDEQILVIKFDSAEIAWLGEVQVEGLYAEKQSWLKRMWQGLFGS